MKLASRHCGIALLAVFTIGIAGSAFAQQGSGSATKGSTAKQGSTSTQGSDSTQGSAAKQETSNKTIAESIDPNGGFSTLYHAVVNAGLADTLKGKGPFTVFAPNDQAFGTLPITAVKNLMENPGNKDLLAAVLKHHVVAGKVMAADVVKLSEAKSVLGETLKIETKDGGVFINGVRVSKTDIVCSNGVIHLIDGVLMPSDAAMNKVKEEMAKKAAQGSGTQGSSSTQGSGTQGSGTNQGSGAQGSGAQGSGTTTGSGSASKGSGSSSK